MDGARLDPSGTSRTPRRSSLWARLTMKRLVAAPPGLAIDCAEPVKATTTATKVAARRREQPILDTLGRLRRASNDRPLRLDTWSKPALPIFAPGAMAPRPPGRFHVAHVPPVPPRRHGCPRSSKSGVGGRWGPRHPLLQGF